MAIELLEDFVMSDDISILAHESYGDLHLRAPFHPREVAPLSDATEFVNGKDDPEGDPSVEMTRARLTEDYFEESPVGGGIATNTTDDDLSEDVSESDESQELAEDQNYPRRSQGTREVMDLRRAVATGFPTDVPKIDDFRPTHEPSENLDLSLESYIVPEFGVVMGGGELATAALTLHGEGIELIRKELKEEGVPKSTADDLIFAFENGGAILAVALNRGGKEPIVMEDLAYRHGATISETFGAPRF